MRFGSGVPRGQAKVVTFWCWQGQGSFVCPIQELIGKLRAGVGRTADPSASLGMTKGGVAVFLQIPIVAERVVRRRGDRFILSKGSATGSYPEKARGSVDALSKGPAIYPLPSDVLRMVTAPPFVIPSEAEGSAVRPSLARSSQQAPGSDKQRNPPLRETSVTAIDANRQRESEAGLRHTQ